MTATIPCAIHADASTCDCATGTRHRLLMAQPDNMLKFMTAGKSIFTVKNRLTGDRATYRVEAKGEGLERTYTVFAFTGSDNSKKGHYTLMGTMDADGTWTPRKEEHQVLDLEASVLIHTPPKSFIRKFIEKVIACRASGTPLTEKEQRRYDSMLRSHKIQGYITDPVKLAMFPNLWDILTNSKPLPEELEFWHEGCCGCCGRRLTVPASVELGHGPNCARALGRVDEWIALNEKLGTDLEAYAMQLKERYADKDSAAVAV